MDTVYYMTGMVKILGVTRAIKSSKDGHIFVDFARYHNLTAIPDGIM